jgi:Fe-Mn family superoxide dismutase
MSFELPPLPYDFSALEPTIDTQTMQIHHDKHHAAYVTNLNKALEGAPELAGKSIDEIVANLNAVPEKIRPAVINNGGGHYNHTVFRRLWAPRAAASRRRSGQSHRGCIRQL